MTRLKLSSVAVALAAAVYSASACTVDVGSSGANPGRTTGPSGSSPSPKASLDVGGTIGGGGTGSGNPTPTPTPTGSGTAVSMVQGVALQPPAVSLNAPPANQASASLEFNSNRQFAATVSFLDRGPGGNADVMWESSDTSRVVVSESGLAMVKTDAATGTVVIKAIAKRDTSKAATASITVTRNTEVELVVD